MRHILSSEINQRRIGYFYAVYSAGSISAAANSLNTAPSVVTRQIQILENELGTLLFERRHRLGMKPTEAANIVLEYYRETRANQDKLEANLYELRAMKRGNITIASPNVYIAALMDEVLNDFYRAYPDINVIVEEINCPQVVAQIREDKAHIGLTRSPLIDEPMINCLARASLPVNLLVGKGHPLAHVRHKITVAEMARYPLALSPLTFSLRDLVQEVEREERIQITPTFTSSASSALKRFAVLSGGTLLSAFAACQEIDSGQLIALDIDHPIFMSAQTHLIVRRGRLLSPSINQLLRLITKQLSFFNQDCSHYPAVRT
ncbi:Putative transcriptional activator, LysR family [Mycoavidus cysteinexigens]|uniref:Transcriptional activator, LysR family n=1 Tax=Mycoavidus cysteinexigens TaxID=1553431 RepID=A0A2Z6EV03_9BURK|nr:LysR family transcriptional regulator [Mycoavidus cysteinexigens]BBE09303.1 Putative transcriptional activator, LysR family [Mycoavidus cysteinexigens]GAM51941.1 hypothetical protein EBME_0404 [bacterium endosymbiont of Mortierella elongata FMR23-6]GLR02038.1 LysR family transcriptional regulator [Mycoavidus cysteinexigens]